MNVIGYIQQGEFSEYKDRIRQEGMPMIFQKTMFLSLYIKERHSV